MKNFYKIVITGGPCGGKTTGLSTIERELSKIGYKVVIINETATEIINSGLGFSAYLNNIEFETNIVKLQLAKEKIYEEACRKLDSENVILLCDRGAMDCKSYTLPEEWKEITKRLNLDDIQLRDNYDAVFHLVTAAKGAEEFYTNENNSARSETKDDAILADDRTLKAWTGHPHFRAIDNSTNFEGKMKRLISEIYSFIGVPEPFEIERKFLIKLPDTEKLLKEHNCKKVEMVQTYLTSNENETRRIRQRGLNGSYILTTKKKISDTKRLELEQKITQREYLSLLNDADTTLHQVKKTRYCLMQNNQYFEVDIYPFAKNTAILEIELTDENEKINFPDYIDVIKEVTNDKKYYNRALAEAIPIDLK